MRCSAGAVWLIASLAAFFARGADESAAYLAPENIFFSKLVRGGGDVVEFVRDAQDPMRSVSLSGWVAETHPDGSTEVRSSFDPTRAKNRYVFRGGRAVSYARKGREQAFPPTGPRANPPAAVAPLELSLCEIAPSDHVKNEMAAKWRGTGRLQWPYRNPNFSGAFFVQILLLSFGVLLVVRWRFLKAILAVIGILSFGALFCTESRGALLGLGAGLLAFALAFRDRLFRRKRSVVFGATAVLLVLGGVLAWKSDALTRGFSGESRWSNSVRLEMWKAAPTMMCDAPQGWGDCRPGEAYFNWYQPIEFMCFTGSLMNNHLDALVGLGWGRRWGYLFAWLLALVLGFRRATADRRPLALSLSLSFGVMACFNPVFAARALWIIPVLALCALLVGTFRMGRRFWLVAGGLSALLASLAVGLFVLAGECDWSGSRSRVRCERSRVTVNGRDPGVWAVDDHRDTLGGIMSCKGIRVFYRANPEAPAIGYVRRISDLPERIGRLVLAGRAGMEWLVALGENPSLRTNLPREVVFLSPPFAPSEVPEGVMKSCRVRLYAGEFAAAYQPEFAKCPSWVTIVPGAELYLPNWMALALGEM